MTRDDDARLGDLLAHLGEGDTRDLFRMLLERGMQELIDAELTATIGAERHERSETRTNHRNGGRTRMLSTPTGDIELRIPKLRAGSFFPSFLFAHYRIHALLYAGHLTGTYSPRSHPTETRSATYSGTRPPGHPPKSRKT